MRKFLASVGNAQLLGQKDGKLFHIADIRTLTDSTLSFSNTMEEVRAGESGQVYGRFAHSAGVQVTLTDAMFDLNYIANLTGAAIEGNATAFYNDEHVTVASNILTLSKTPARIGNACGLEHVVVWARDKGCKAKGEWVTLFENASHQFSLAGTKLEGKEASELCVRYFVDKPEARMLAINSAFIPAECILILTTRLFSGDANAPETGKPVGEITIKIPRFQMDGQFDLTMAMNSASTTSMSGIALAVNDGGCDDKGIYCEIVEVDTGSTVFTGLQEIAVEAESAFVGMTPVVFAYYENEGQSYSSVLDNSILSFTPALSGAGKWNAASEHTVYTVKLKEEDGSATTKPEGIVTVQIESASH